MWYSTGDAVENDRSDVVGEVFWSVDCPTVGDIVFKVTRHTAVRMGMGYRMDPWAAGLLLP